MKQQIDLLIAQDQLLEEVLTWVNQKACTVRVDKKSVIVRAFYFDLALGRALIVGGTLDLARTLDRNLTCNLERNLALDLALDRALGLDQIYQLTTNTKLIFERVLDRAKAHARSCEPGLEETLQQLKEQLPDSGTDGKKFQQWWSEHGMAWTEQLRAVMISQRNIGHNWQFSARQRDLLKQYYDANLLLINCLNSNCYITQPVREQIEQTLLLPIA